MTQPIVGKAAIDSGGYDWSEFNLNRALSHKYYGIMQVDAVQIGGADVMTMLREIHQRLEDLEEYVQVSRDADAMDNTERRLAALEAKCT